MSYEVFDTGINRLIGVYNTEEEAMMLARALISSNGKEYAEDLAVGWERPDGSFAGSWTGDALIARADEVLGQQEHASARPAEFIPSRGNTGRSENGGRLPIAAAGRWAQRSANTARNAIVRSRRDSSVQAPARTRRRKG